MRTRNTRQSGQTAILFTLGLTTMFGMVGLVSDVGYVYYRKQGAQAAAQAAAAAAVKAAYNSSGGNFVCGSNSVQCDTGYPPSYTCPTSISGNGSNNLEVGCLYAAANGYSGSKVSFQSGTGAVDGVYVTYWVIARVSEKLPLFFSSVLGSNSTSLTARSIAGYVPATSGGCVYVLGQGAQALKTTGNGFLATGCGVWVDSTSSDAVDLSGANTTICVGTYNGSTCTPSTTSTVQIVGSGPGYSCSNNGQCIQPAADTGAASSGDPLAGLPAPNDTGSCTNLTNGSHQTNPTGTLVFCGAVTLNNGSMTLDPGTYIFKNGGLSTSGNAKLYGTGVTLYFENGNGISLSGNGDVQLSAPTSGTYQGILMFQSATDSQDAYLTGGSSQVLQGVAYFPDSLLHYSGGGTSNNESQSLSIVSKYLDIKGNAYIQNAGNSPYLTSFSGVAIIE